MTSRYETRAEKQAFLEQLSRVHDGDRPLILKEHQQYLNGQRPTDADFSSARKQTSQQGRQPRAWVPPTGKDASYMRANKHSALMTRRAVAAKTLAGSGKKRLGPRKKLVHEPSDEDEDYEDEDYEDEEEGDDDECEDEDYGSAGFYAESQEGSEAESGNDTTRAQAKTSKASRKKSTVATKEASKATAAAKKPRKKSARTLAKEVREAAVAGAKAAKVKAAQDKATEQQRAGKEANSSSDSRRPVRAVTPATSATNSDLATPSSPLLHTTTHGETSGPPPTARLADPQPPSAMSTAHDDPPLPQPAESSDFGLNLGALDSDCEDEDEELVLWMKKTYPSTHKSLLRYQTLQRRWIAQQRKRRWLRWEVNWKVTTMKPFSTDQCWTLKNIWTSQKTKPP
ncbi:hypothetical protein DVH05_006433 [Phytophthora capsici]|nr:hypothetical protein DVH05_006433 [Phytophthora capsici]